jgi:hypothetical protein
VKVQLAETPELGRERFDVAAQGLYANVVAVVRPVRLRDVRVRLDGERHLGVRLPRTETEASNASE